jgi:hypothetical protein
MHGPRQPGIYMLQRHLHNFTDPVLVDIVHRKAFDLVLAEDPFLGGIDVAEADVDAVDGRKIGDRDGAWKRTVDVGLSTQRTYREFQRTRK